jgi:hypothetical protein
MPRPARRTCLAALALATLACGCSSPERPAWPARNYSGVYRVHASVESNTCPTPVFASGDSLTFTLLQTAQNAARVDIPPVVSVAGDFTGDRLEAYAAIAARQPGASENAASAAPGAKADSAAGRADSAVGGAGDSIRYRLRLDFEGKGLHGTYRVEQPALPAGVKACIQVFRVDGAEASATSEPG